jgi:hypothetical protein
MYNRRARSVLDFIFMYYDTEFNEYALLSSSALLCIKEETKWRVSLVKTMDSSSPLPIRQDSDALVGTLSLQDYDRSGSLETDQHILEEELLVTNNQLEQVIRPVSYQSSLQSVLSLQPISDDEYTKNQQLDLENATNYLIAELHQTEEHNELVDNYKELKKEFLQNCYESHVKIDDMFGGDVGYIVIDCLLEQALVDTDAKLPWEYNKNTGICWEMYGGQILHLVYIVEKNLKNWKMFHPNLDLVYFKNYVPSFDPEFKPRMMGLYVVARQILFDHLFEAELFEDYHQFDTNWSTNDEFADHMILERPAFICVPYYDRDFTFWSLCNYDVGVILKPGATKDHFAGYLISLKKRDLKYKLLARGCRDMISNWVPDMYMDIEKHMIPSNSTADISASNNVFNSINLEDPLHEIMVNSLIDACRCMEKVKPILISAVLATIIMQPACSIEFRSVIPDICYPSLNSLLDKFYLAITRRLTISSIGGSDLLDLFDGKLCHHMLNRMESNEDVVLHYEDEHLYELVMACIDPANICDEPLEGVRTTDCFVTDYKFDTEVKLTNIDNPLLEVAELAVQIEGSEPIVDSGDTFNEIFHYHSNRKFIQNHAALLDWAKKFKNKKSLITTFPYITEANFRTVRLKKHEEIIESNNILTAWINRNTNTAGWFTKINTIQRLVEKVEYDEAFCPGKHRELLRTVYKRELQCFEYELDELYRGCSISEDAELNYDQKVHLWKILCWTRFISDFMKLKQAYIDVDRIIEVGKKLKSCLRTVCLYHEAGDEHGQDIINTNQLHLLMTIQEKLPTPLLKQFKNTKVKLLQEADRQIHEASQQLDGYHIVRSLMIKKQIVSDLDFIPDEWQLRLMDHLDQNHTVLVSAPTSSGKTFISSYLIKRILHLSDKGLVVFIVPTNALVNQVYLDIYTSLGKKSSNKDITVGIFTKFQRTNVYTCQVLISTPQMFEIMVLSQTVDNQRIRERTKYLILDEIHSMNNEGGSCWETIMMMIRCPILALSATLGNPEPFMNWLKTIRREHEVHLVECQHRFVPLSYFLYNPYNESVDHVHPLAALNPYQLHKKELERLPTLGIKECFEFLAVTEVEYDGKHNPFEEYCDGSILGDNRNKCISRKQVIRFQEGLTNKLRSLCFDQEHYGIMMSIFSTLRQPVQESYQNIMNIPRYFTNYQFDLIKKLRETRLLPAICFIFDKSIIIDTATNLYEHLMDDPDIYDLWRDPATSLKSRVEIEKSIEILNKIKVLPDIAIPALRKGIGMHYASLDPAYQQEVERLLKANILPLVLATSTLALGVVSTVSCHIFIPQVLTI